MRHHVLKKQVFRMNTGEREMFVLRRNRFLTPMVVWGLDRFLAPRWSRQNKVEAGCRAVPRQRSRECVLKLQADAVDPGQH